MNLCLSRFASGYPAGPAMPLLPLSSYSSQTHPHQPWYTHLPLPGLSYPRLVQPLEGDTINGDCGTTDRSRGSDNARDTTGNCIDCDMRKGYDEEKSKRRDFGYKGGDVDGESVKTHPCRINMEKDRDDTRGLKRISEEGDNVEGVELKRRRLVETLSPLRIEVESEPSLPGDLRERTPHSDGKHGSILSVI